MAEIPTCYMAVKFGPADNDWVDTGQSIEAPGLPTGDGGILPKKTTAYGDVYNAKFRAVRAYQAINSSRGPQTAYRATFGAMEVERLGGDAITPLLLDYCLSGEQLEWVYFVLPVALDPKAQTKTYVEQYHVRLGEVFVSKLDVGARRYMGRTIDNEYRNPEVAYTLAIDELELVYGTIALESLGVECGWNVQTDSAWNTPST